MVSNAKFCQACIADELATAGPGTTHGSWPGITRVTGTGCAMTT